MGRKRGGSRLLATLAVVLLAACAGGTTATPRASDGCDAEVKRKIACDHLYPQLADRVRDVCVRSWSCASTFWRPEALGVMVDCNAHAPCSVDCDHEITSRVPPLPQEIAFANACQASAATCSLDCNGLTSGHRENVPAFWDAMASCLTKPGCGESTGCLRQASMRPMQAIACLM